MGFPYKRFGSSPTDANDGGVFDKFTNYQLEKQGALTNAQGVAPNPAHTATGGMISDYEAPNGNFYRAHVFLNPGTFSVTDLSSQTPAHVEYMVVAGGGGGGGAYR